MTVILFLVTILLGVMLFDTRERLSRLERRVRDNEGPRERAPWGPVIVRDAPPPPAAQTLIVEADVPDEIESVDVVEEVEDAPAPEPIAQPMTEAEPEPEPVMAEPLIELPPAPPARQSASTGFGFEDLFGRKLPIWAGGITLLVAAVLMVKYSIDAGLLSPVVRVMLGLLFGAGLIGGAEIARRKEALVQDPRVAQALAGAGIGSLYAATLAAANLYGLIGPGLAFAGLSAITALAMALALRFGAPCAVLGLVGGLATPAAVQSGAPNVPLLAGYLAIVIGSLTLLSRRQRWVWLGVSALIGGAGWSLLMILLGGLDSLSTLSLGLLVLLLGLGLPAFAADRHATPILQGIAAVVAALQLALLVATGHFAPLTWGLYALLSLAFLWLAHRMPILRQAVAVPLLTALALTAIWPAPDATTFAAVMAGIVLIYGGHALWRLWREQGSLVEAGQISTIALAGYLLSHWHFFTNTPGQDLRFALLAIGFALLPALGVALGWTKPARQEDARFAMLALFSALLLVFAALIGLPTWTAPIAIAMIAAGLIGLAVKAQDNVLAIGALLYLGAAILALPVTLLDGAELLRFIGAGPAPHPAQAMMRWGMVMLATIAFAWCHARTPLRLMLQPLAILLGYGMVAQIVPAPWLAIVAAAALLILTEANEQRTALRLQPAQAMLALVIAGWAVEPLLRWALHGFLSLAAEPLLVTSLPALLPVTQHVLVPALACALALWRMRERLSEMTWQPAMAMIGAVVLIALHIFYKHVFAIADADGFVRLGLAERTLWEVALIGAGAALWQIARAREAAIGLIGLGLAHNLVYTLVLHNPLWAGQAVGAWPLVNLLLPAFAIPLAALLLLGQVTPVEMQRLQRPADLLRMAVILLFAYATLRQLFAGNLLIGTATSEVENIGRSVLAIALAMGFLLWGIRRGLRDWRIASLLLMLGAVGKVFLFDASGLEGLLRIASFLALGFSLIGIGWLYSRYLKPDTI